MLNLKSKSGIFLVIVWLLIPLVVLGFLIYGLTTSDEIWDRLIWLMAGFLLASILVDLAALVSIFAGDRAIQITQRIWVVVMAMVFLVALIGKLLPTELRAQGVEFLAALSILILTFPMGMFVIAASQPFVFFLRWLPIPPEYSSVAVVVITFSLIAYTSYVQWFVWLPNFRTSGDAPPEKKNEALEEKSAPIEP